MWESSYIGAIVDCKLWNVLDYLNMIQKLDAEQYVCVKLIIKKVSSFQQVMGPVLWPIVFAF